MDGTPERRKAGPSGEVDPSDGELVRRVKQGDRAAFDALMERHQQMVLGLAFRMLGQYEEAVDLAQEAFLRMWRGIPQFREEASFRTWAFQITLNLARHRRRWYARHRTAKTVSLEAPMSGEEDPEEGGLALAERMADCSPNPRDQVVRRELRATLHGAIARLPVPFRTAVVLRDIQGLPYEEIAAIVGEPIGTVRSRLHRARAMLQAALREVRHEL